MLSGNILITGGSGTLGHAIVRTAEREEWPCTFTIYSRSELRQAQMRQKHPRCRYILGDVRDYDRTAAAIAGHDLVIHAAAMKRVDECERQPGECIATNVAGSLNVVRACLWHSVPRCIGIGTDKQVKAITVYGASKLLMAGLFANSRTGATIFTMARYGNVIASNGSVIPLWRKQAASGQPLTITDRRCTRFWMAPSDAVRAIVRASVLEHGATYVPRMGVLSLPEMARIIAPEADQVEVGLRATEKIHEDLIHEDEIACEVGVDGFVVGAFGLSGTRYTTEYAPKLSAEQFQAMLAEAESYD